MIGHPNDSSKATDRIRSVVSMMGNPDKIFFCGDIGSGLAAKISNNYLAGSFNVAISQAMSIGIRSGVDKQMLFDVIRNSSGQSWMLENHQPVPGLVATAPSSRGYEPSFRHRLMMKDIGLGIQAAREVGIEPTIAETALQMYERAANDEEVKDLDYTSVYRMINEAANKR